MPTDSLAEEIERVRASSLLGEPGGRLRELFDYLAARSLCGETASQADVQAEVFGQGGPLADEATARVYVHRLRKRLEDDRAEWPERLGLTIPPGAYRLQLAGGGATVPEAASTRAKSLHPAWLLATALGLAVVVLSALLFMDGPSDEESAATDAHLPNAIWQPFVESERPIMVVVGDYYLFGDIDPVRPEEGRLIRDFRVDSEVDLERIRKVFPEQFEGAEDVGLNYLPFSSAYALRALMPVLARHDVPVSLMPASEVDASTFRYYNIVYVGLVSGMGFLEDVAFMRSHFAVGESYDELVDTEAGTTYTSGEARTVTSSFYYKDYGYLSVFEEPGGARIAIVAGARDTGLRGLSPLLAGAALPPELRDVAEDGPEGGYEALFEFTGQQRESLDGRLIAARARP